MWAHLNSLLGLDAVANTIYYWWWWWWWWTGIVLEIRGLGFDNYFVLFYE